MYKTKILSIIVPVYNCEKYIEKCIVSIATQSIPQNEYEVIIVDDKSSDNSVNICLNICKEYKNIKLIKLEKNTLGGAGIPSNIGISYACGEFIGFVDSDDYIEKDMFESLILEAQKRNSDLTFCDFKIYNQDDDKIYPSYDKAIYDELLNFKFYNENLNSIKKLALRLSPVPWRKLYRRSFCNEFNIRYPEGNFFYEDNPLHWFAICKARNISFVNKAPIIHRINRVGQTISFGSNRLIDFSEHIKTINLFLKENNIKEEYKLEFINWCVDQTLWIFPRLGENRKKYINILSNVLNDISYSDIISLKKI